MTTVVQTTYRPQQAAGLVGMIADEINSSVHTRACETAAGIGFGLALSQGTGERGAIIGGSAFVGISVRDVTYDGSPIDPLGNINTTPDVYPQYASMGVMTTGRIWVLCRGGTAGGVVAGNGLFYNTTSGLFTNSASGTSATGSITFTRIPNALETITVNGVVITFRASGATGDDVNIAGTLGDTMVALAAKLNGSVTAGLASQTYGVDPASPGGSGQGSGANTLLIAADAVGTAPNAYTLATTVGGSTASGTTLAGGTAAATAITGGYWVSNSLAGQLAIVSLGIQR